MPYLDTAATHTDLWCDENPNQALKMDCYLAQAGTVYGRMHDAPCEREQGVPLQL
jgi:hypothetical protein